MIVAIAILIIICFVLCLSGVLCNSDKFRYMICLIVVILLFIISFLLATYLQSTPTAMDVYRGNAALQYTVVEGQIVDSTVVFLK